MTIKTNICPSTTYMDSFYTENILPQRPFVYQTFGRRRHPAPTNGNPVGDILTKERLNFETECQIM